jgi:hypothetical protein
LLCRGADKQIRKTGVRSAATRNSKRLRTKKIINRCPRIGRKPTKNTQSSNSCAQTQNL